MTLDFHLRVSRLLYVLYDLRSSLSLSLFLSSSRFEARSAPVNEWAKQSPTALGSIGRPPGTQLRKKKPAKSTHKHTDENSNTPLPTKTYC